MKMGNLTRLLLVAGGFLGSEETRDDLGDDLGCGGYLGDILGRCGKMFEDEPLGDIDW